MKIAIIGAGPAGLYAALAAAERGFRTDLYEKRAVGEGIVCGECIFDSLGILSRPGQGLLHPVEEVVLTARARHTLAIGRYRKLWMMDRRNWQEGLAEAAAARGVRLETQTKIDPERLRRMQDEYDGIVDASGAPSVTSRAYGFSGRYLEDGLAAYQAVLRGDFTDVWPRIAVRFLPELPPERQPGYAWIFPKDAHRANCGVVCTMRGSRRGGIPDLKTLLADFLRSEGLAGAEILKTGGGLGPGWILPRLTYGRILLAGDAAGLTSPLHGGGIDLACLSGVLAVEALADGAPGIERYRPRLMGYVRRKLAVEALAIRKMRTLDFDAFDALLGGVCSRSNLRRAATALRHPALALATLKWLLHRETAPAGLMERA
ncbi:MAG TPA: NAD(P)/FAD-dependent oxidoreductase [Syntrophales bacterium]|nr:NAD(P)/FAD-dependent oxidoreductase [Syntrophales bacterium]